MARTATPTRADSVAAPERRSPEGRTAEGRRRLAESTTRAFLQRNLLLEARRYMGKKSLIS